MSGFLLFLHFSSQLGVKCLQLLFILLFEPDVFLVEFGVEDFVLYDGFGFGQVSDSVDVLADFEGGLRDRFVGCYLLAWFFLLFFRKLLLYGFGLVFFLARIRFFIFVSVVDEGVIIVFLLDDGLNRVRLLFVGFFKLLGIVDVDGLSSSFGSVSTSHFPGKCDVCIFRHI